MSAHLIQSPDGTVSGIITLANIYEFEGFTFEYHHFLGPCKLKKSDWEPAARSGLKFYQAIDRWNKLTPPEKEATRLHG